MDSPASETHPPRLRRRRVDLLASCALFLGLLSAAEPALAFKLDVIGPNGEAVDKFRWVLEEDATFAITPGAAGTQALSTTFHRSHMPVIAAGTEADLRQLRDETIVDATKRYFLSVRPESGYTIGGTSVAPASKTVTVQVNTLPVPTAQISILAFNDHQPLNNAFDTGEEPLPGLTVVLSEAGGRYGHSGGQVIQDAFGNPLGTTYSANGSVAQIGTGVIKTGADGKVTIKNLVPAKYGVEIVAPDGWVQTTTIEGTRTIDAWVKAGEPASWEGEPQQPHVVVGFVQPQIDTTVLSGGTTLKGQVVNKHMSPLPDFVFHPGSPYEHTTCWIGLNDTQAGSGRAVYAQRCQDQGRFEIPNVPAGAYQLVVWDDYLDMIIDFSAVTVNADGTCNAGGSCDLGQLQVFNWFHRQEHTVFLDNDGDGFRDCFTTECNNAAAGDEIGLPEQTINLRWRDGTIYQSFPTDHMGYVPFDEVFPFFSWLVAEVDYLRYKATGLTVVVDAGGEVKSDQGWDYPSADKVNPQVQAEVNDNTGNRYSRTETGPVLTQGFQGFMGQTSIFQWGKKPYSGNENGGISGIVHYATTRAEDDPRYAAAENWEPGIPHIQVALYEDKLGDGTVDDKNNDGAATLADVDNYPFGWRTNGDKGANDVDRNGNGTFDAGDAVQIVTTDSWDDSLPTGCPGTEFAPYGTPLDCYDGMRNWNQVRPAVFDGGYAFTGLEPGTYSEQVILWKPVKLQGWGSGVTFLNAYKVPSESLTRWQDKVRALVAAGRVDLLPGQNAADPLSAEAGPGVTVLAKQGEFTAARGALIDGITITGATLGGGIFVNGHADFLTISNNRLEGNQGTFNGGVRLGHPYLTVATDTGTAATDASNDSVTIRYNHILKNGSQDGAGGGVAICTGSDGYAVLGNFICGNFSMGDGGGIGHLGRSDDGRIEGNRILFNQVANQQLSASGGGIYVGGLAPLNGVTSLTEGSGSVVITGNRIQGNQAASGDGGGIRLERINGLDLTDDSPASFQVGIYNSMIVNNSAGLAGAGISLQDAVAVDIVNDTVANNDSLGTAADAFPAGSPNQSQSQPSGIVARAHGSALATAVGAGFSQPRLSNLIVLNNRAFSFLNTTGYSGLTPKPDAAAVNWDLGVLGTSGTLAPTNSIGQTTNPTAYFVSPYYNGLDGHLAADEGGNAIDVRVKPLTATLSDYHLATENNVGRAVQDAIADDVDDLSVDYDAAGRPTTGSVDAGADEFDNADHPLW